MDDRLAQIREQYRDSLSTKADDLEACWRAAQSDFLSDSRIEELRNMVHKLGGSAGMYGYESLANEAKALERCIVDGVDDSGDWRKMIAEGVSTLLVSLRSGGEAPVPDGE